MGVVKQNATDASKQIARQIVAREARLVAVLERVRT